MNDYHLKISDHSQTVSILLRETFLKRYKDYFASLKETHLRSSSQQQAPSLPDIEAITYASSAVFSENLSNWCRSFVTSYIIAGDIVPRISLGQGMLKQHVRFVVTIHFKIFPFKLQSGKITS